MRSERSTRARLSLRAAIMGLVMCVLAGRAGAQITVHLDFSERPDIGQAQRNAIQACIEGKYAFTGALTFTQTQPAGGAVKTINFREVRGAEWGRAFKRNNRCDMNTGLNFDELSVFDTEAERTNLFCETGAHELGHLLCAVHNRDMPPSLMTVGNMVPDLTRAMGGREFTESDRLKIMEGIAMTVAGLSWDLVAKFDDRDVIAVEGAPEGEYKDDDRIIDGVVTIPNNTFFDFGYMNPQHQFVPMIHAPDTTGVIIFSGGDIADFAIRGAPGSPFPGQVFNMEQYGRIVAFADARPPSLAVFPPQQTEYYGTVNMVIDLTKVGGSMVAFSVSCQPMSSTHGWSVTPPAAIPATGWPSMLVIAIGIGIAAVLIISRTLPRAG